MHTRNLHDDEGTFSENVATSAECPECHKQEVTYQIWESNDGAHEDFKYTCHACGHKWWIEGIDA